MEFIICSAIWFQDGKVHVHQPKNISSGYVVCGRRHHNCFSIKADIYGECLGDTWEGKRMPHEQGFLTNSDRYVDRKAGLLIARQAAQLLYEPRTDELFSENIF